MIKGILATMFGLAVLAVIYIGSIYPAVAGAAIVLVFAYAIGKTVLS